MLRCTMTVCRCVASLGRKRVFRIRYIALYLFIACSYLGLCHIDLRRSTSSEEEFVQYLESDRNYFYLRDSDLKSQPQSDASDARILTSYYDSRLRNSEPLVRIFAYAQVKIITAFCCFRLGRYTSWICSKRPVRPKYLSSRELSGTNNETYQAHELMFICKLHESSFDRLQLSSVTLIVIKDNVATRISEHSHISRDHNGSYVRNKTAFTVCILPNGKSRNERFSAIQDLVEYREVLALLGSSHVVLYYGDIHVIDSTLKGTNGISFETVQSSLNATRFPILARNDCVYRSMQWTHYVIFLDLHELLVPTLARDWSAMLETLEHVHNTTKVGAYILQVFDFFDETTNGTASYAISSHSGNKKHDQKNKHNLKYLPRLVRFRTREKNASTDNVILGQPTKIDYVTGTGSVKMLPGFSYVNVPVDFATVHRFIHGHKKLKGLVIDASKDKLVPKLLKKLHTLNYYVG